MSKYLVYIIPALLLWGVPSFAQNNVEIFADVRNNDSLQKLVTIFTEQLKKSTAGNFAVRPTSSYNGHGIYINTTIAANQKVKPSAKLLQAGVEAYSIDANAQAVQILGNCNMAVGHGIFSYLELIGYRYYFANPAWYVVPVKPILFRKYNIVSAPAFHHRRIWYGYGTGSKIADADYNFWVLANKLGGTMNASYGHAYEDIAFRNRDAFAKHPEWCYPPLPSGKDPYDIKFDVSREDLIQFVIQDVEKRIETSLKNKTNSYKMISMAPSDGPGTCNSPACQKLGTITDRVYYLTNRVAKAIKNKYPETLIGCMAYGEYAPPPTKRVEPNVFVAITTAFNGSKYSNEQLMEEWRKKGAIVGIYDYFSWYAWDFDIPGQSLASRPIDMTNNIKKYHALGVRAYEGESSIGWVSKGLGYFLAARQMWDINADALGARKEFFRLCFNKAADKMQQLWAAWEQYSFQIIREGELAKWIDFVTDAEKIETAESVKKRFFQVKSYLHWLALYHIYQEARTETNLFNLLSYGYRKLDDGSVSGFPASFELGNRSGIPGMANDDKAKWKYHATQIVPAEIDMLIKGDRSILKASAPIKQFLPATKFQTIPDIARFKKMIADTGAASNAYWYTNEWVIEIKKKGPGNYIDFTGDFIRDTTVRKPFKISVYKFTADGNITALPRLFYYEYNKMTVKERIRWPNLDPGYYTFIIEDPVKIFSLSFSPSINFSMVMRATRPVQSTLINYSFIYVPEGVTRFNVVNTSLLEFVTPTGRKVHLDNKPHDIQIEVQKGEAGLWRLRPLYGNLFVEGIPPYLGTSPTQMLIPVGIK